MKHKYILTNVTKILNEDVTLYRIRAAVDFGNVKAGTLGGYVQSTDNLSHEGDCWIADEACVYGFARVSGNALVRGKAVLRRYARAYGNSVVCDRALLKDAVHVYGNAYVGLNSFLADGAVASGNAKVLCESFRGKNRTPNLSGYGTVTENAQLLEWGFVRGDAVLKGNAVLRGRAGLSGKAVAGADAVLEGYARMSDETMAMGHVLLTGHTKLFGKSAAYGRCTVGGKSLLLCNAHVAGTGEYYDLQLSGEQYYRGEKTA